ncbi:MAG: peptidoglycan DD-metalloendopeptidase family protein [Bacteroidia bacterium]|jgi:septal ring factor EnvC (AmiA/AmiB activator)|nr:peptidoglycan DD-metalloendopeptidase family protein [Bacteroidia bacterium]
MMRKLIGFALTLVLLFSAGHAFAQTADRKSELEASKKKIEEELSLVSKLLEETRQSKTNTLSELNLLQARLKQRENLIATLRTQISRLDNQLSQTQRELSRLQKELEGLKSEYAAMITFAYRNRNGLNKLMFLFSADSYNQAYRRMKYLQQYAAMRKTQIERISETHTRMEAQKQNLASERDEKARLLDDERRQQVLLNNERMNIELSVQKISRQERDLQQQVRQKQQEARQLQKEIERIIAEEIRRAREASGRPASPDRLMNLTPEEQLLSNQFVQNRGRLPWPVERGIISSRFGEQPHPVLRKVTIKNNGIDIATTRGSEARAIFEGVVVSTNRITATNNAVILRHGDFFTVYSNLEQVYVKRGDRVNHKDLLGLIHTDKTEGKTELHFEIWQNRTQVDPALWLAK